MSSHDAYRREPHGSLLILFLGELGYFGETSGYVGIVFALVRHEAVTAILYAAADVFIIAPAFFAERVERAIAEKTVKVLGPVGLVAREKFTFAVLKKSKMRAALSGHITHNISLRS